MRTALILAFCAGCGDGSTDPTGPPPDPCSPHLPANWMPRWRPPLAPRPDACSAAQIDREYAFCEGASATSAACAAFRGDPNNGVCISCLFSDENAAAYGPIIQSDRFWRSNTAGCIALLDGDASEGGCGAKVQAASSCYDLACSECVPVEGYVKCRQQASDTICRSYYLDAVCLLRPAYASCTAYATNQEYFIAAAKFFCANGSAMRSRAEGRAVE